MLLRKNRALRCLVLAHLFVATALWWWEERAHSLALPPAAFLAAFLGQVGLLGVWAALAPVRWPWRVIGAGAGTLIWSKTYAYRWWGGDFRADDWFRDLKWAIRDSFDPRVWLNNWHFRMEPLAAMIVLGVAAALVAVCRRKAHLRKCDPATLGPPLAERHFSLRHLLLLVFVLSLAMSFAVSFHDFTHMNTVPWEHPQLVVAYSAETMFLATYCTVVVTLAAVWAALRPGPIAPRLGALACLATMLGVAFAYGFTSSFYRQHLPENCGFMALAFVLQAAVVAGTLVVVRRLGFRLVREESNSLTPAAHVASRTA
jgi:hypothetical protein